MPNPADVQSFVHAVGAKRHRYAYVLNNPLKYRDPSGNTPWDVVDVGFWIWSAKDFYNDPTWGNAGWLALDTFSLLPLIPSSGYLTRGGKVFVKMTSKVGHADEVADLVNRVQKSIPKARTLDEVSLTSLETIQKYGIDRYLPLSGKAPAGFDVHHLVEKRFWRQLGFGSKGQGRRHILSAIVDEDTHRLAEDSITRKLQEILPYGEAGTNQAKLQEIWDAHKEVYEEIGHQDWAELIWEVYFQHVPDLVK